MTVVERIIPPKVLEDGSVHYSSVMSPSDDSVAVCHMVPDRVIPIVFVPGVMGSNLSTNAGARETVWLMNSTTGALTDWGYRGPETRKKKLDPNKTEVFNGGKIPEGTAQTEKELRRRGWGEVGYASYGEFLPWLENALNGQNALNDSAIFENGWRGDFIKRWNRSFSVSA